VAAVEEGFAFLICAATFDYLNVVRRRREEESDRHFALNTDTVFYYYMQVYVNSIHGSC
jgi:hypothetical protein